MRGVSIADGNDGGNIKVGGGVGVGGVGTTANKGGGVGVSGSSSSSGVGASGSSSGSSSSRGRTTTNRPHQPPSTISPALHPTYALLALVPVLLGPSLLATLTGGSFSGEYHFLITFMYHLIIK